MYSFAGFLQNLENLENLEKHSNFTSVGEKSGKKIGNWGKSGKSQGILKSGKIVQNILEKSEKSQGKVFAESCRNPVLNALHHLHNKKYYHWYLFGKNMQTMKSYNGETSLVIWLNIKLWNELN